MRIVHLTPSPVYGGLFTALEGLVREQSRSHAVIVLSPVSPRSERAGSDHEWIRWRASGNADWRALLFAQQVVLESCADALLLHAGSPGECATLALLLGSTVPTVVIEQLPVYYYARPSWTDFVLAACKRRAARWVSVSDTGARTLELMWRLPERTIRTIRNGADPPLGATTPLPPHDREAIVLALGPTEPRKGFDTFVQVAEVLSPSFPGWRWLWVGGEQRNRVGMVDVEPWRADVGDLLARSALLLIPSRAEGLPLVLLEAFSCRTPVVASAVGGIPEAICDGIEAVLVPPEATQLWIETVRAVLLSPARRRELAIAGFERWQRDFTARAMAQRYEALIEELLHGA